MSFLFSTSSGRKSSSGSEDDKLESKIKPLDLRAADVEMRSGAISRGRVKSTLPGWL
jgi:hypothetical protein